MTKYLLDTNVIVDLLRGVSSGVQNKLLACGIDYCAISDITLYELYCGAQMSRNVEYNMQLISNLAHQIEILPVSDAYQMAAEEKVRLKTRGEIIDDIDLLIACSAKCSGRILVTNNLRHMSRIPELEIEDWR